MLKLAPDFFHSSDGIFYAYLDVFTKKVRFRPKIHKRTFSAVPMDFGTFSTLMMDFSTVEMGIFGNFVLILFYRYGGNRRVVTQSSYLEDSRNLSILAETVPAVADRLRRLCDYNTTSSPPTDPV